MVSIAVIVSIKDVMNILFQDSTHRLHIRKMAVGTQEQKTEYMELIVRQNQGRGWRIDSTLIEAATSLLLYHIHETQKKQSQTRTQYHRQTIGYEVGRARHTRFSDFSGGT